MRFWLCLGVLWGAALWANEPFALENVTVIDATGAAPRSGMTVIVRGDRIAGIFPSEQWKSAEGLKVVDGSGKFLIPGLWDMHAHWYDGGTLSLFIANGVTGIRQMMGNPLHLGWRSNIQAGKLVGPRQYIASPIFDGPKPLWPGSVGLGSAEQAREAVRNVRNAGADFIKVYSLLPREVYFAIADETKKLGISFAGHIPLAVTAEEAVEAGQHSVEHIYGVNIATSSHHHQLMNELTTAVHDKENPKAAIGLWRGKKGEMLKHHDPVRAKILFDLFAEKEVWHCPTLTVLRSIAYSDDESLTEHRSLRYVPPMMKSYWRKRETNPTVKAGYRQALEMTGKMFQAGVPLLAGTDVGNPYIAPGFSLHEELDLLVDAGLTPMAALQAATSNAARFMGRDDLGTVEVGKLADLVLLNANPLEDIHNTTKIHAVITNGKFHDRAALDRLLAEDEPKQ